MICTSCGDTSGTGFALKTGFLCVRCYGKRRKAQKRRRKVAKAKRPR